MIWLDAILRTLVVYAIAAFLLNTRQRLAICVAAVVASVTLILELMWIAPGANEPLWPVALVFATLVGLAAAWAAAVLRSVAAKAWFGSLNFSRRSLAIGYILACGFASLWTICRSQGAYVPVALAVVLLLLCVREWLLLRLKGSGRAVGEAARTCCVVRTKSIIFLVGFYLECEGWAESPLYASLDDLESAVDHSWTYRLSTVPTVVTRPLALVRRRARRARS